MGVYSNIQIKALIEAKHIICHPLIEKNIAGSSIDVTLGEWYYRTERTGVSGFYNPFDPKDVLRYFDGPHKAEIHRDWAKNNGRQLFEGIPPSQPIIVVRPGERLLGHTHEFIGIKAPGTSTLQARSTWGRNGVAVCIDAGWGDPGYINRWTLEIYNMNQHESVVLPVGERIAQMVFYETGPVKSEYHHLSGKYQTGASNSIENLVRSWSPEQMLPKAYKDRRSLPVKIKGLK